MFYIICSLLISFNLYGQTFTEGKYYNFNITNKLKSKLSNNDLINIEIQNTTNSNKELFLVFSDNQSHNYWSKLNFKTTLVPGTNKLTFNLNRFVGERGSIKYARKINFKKLKQMFLSVNPDKYKNNKFKIIKITYTKNRDLKLPQGSYAFNFQGAKVKNIGLNVFTTISNKDSYKKRKGYGFTEIDLWRSKDTKIAPHHLSHSLSVNKATFRVKLPKGKYIGQLNWNELGYWDIPFWKERVFKINNKLVLKEKRSENDFLNQLFIFSKEPKALEHPFEQLYKNVFKPYTFEFENIGDYVDMSFYGDTSAVSLNTLILWPKKNDKEMKAFLLELSKTSVDSFDQQFRYISIKDKNKRKLSIYPYPINKPFIANKSCLNDTQTKFLFSNNSVKNMTFCVESNDKSPIQVTFSDFKNGSAFISKDAFYIKQLNYNFKSIDLNHETYSLQATRLVSNDIKTIKLNDYNNRYINVSFFGGAYKPGTYKGKIILTQGSAKTTLNLKISIINKKYKELPINTGFIGLSPFPKTYFKSDKLSILEQKSYNESLDLLQQIGMNLFTDIPTPFISYNSTNEKFSLNTNNSMEIIKKSSSKNIFFYTGDFPKMFFNDDERNAAQSQIDFNKNMIAELKKFQKRSGKNFVYLYSDEPTGYRDAVDYDLKLMKLYQSKYPSLLLGGFGNLYDWDKGKRLYKAWSVGLYSDIPSKKFFKKAKRANKIFGVYNLCAENHHDLSFCFGFQLYKLHKANIKNYFEWHASAIHNYPGFDLDGRESDIGVFYSKIDGSVGVTKRYLQVVAGLEVFHKLRTLEDYLNNRKAPGLKEEQAKKWLQRIQKAKIFPIKRYYEKYHLKNQKLQNELNTWLEQFLL